MLLCPPPIPPEHWLINKIVSGKKENEVGCLRADLQPRVATHVWSALGANWEFSLAISLSSPTLRVQFEARARKGFVCIYAVPSVSPVCLYRRPKQSHFESPGRVPTLSGCVGFRSELWDGENSPVSSCASRGGHHQWPSRRGGDGPAAKWGDLSSSAPLSQSGSQFARRSLASVGHFEDEPPAGVPRWRLQNAGSDI